MKTNDKKLIFRRLLPLTMLLFVAFSGLRAQTPYAIWCSGNHTLYFTFTSKNLTAGGTFNGHYITNIWKGNAVVESGVQPQWNATVRSYLQHVEIDSLFKKALPTSTREWFYRCKKLESIEGLEYLNTAEVTNMNEMFRECELLTELDVSRFRTENVTDMGSMFRGCSRLESLDVSWFLTWQVEDMSHMFEGCSSLTDLSFFTLINHTFLTTMVTDMSYMFYECSSLKKLDITEFQTANVTNMSYMFYGCSGLKTLDLRRFNTRKVTNMTSMFNGCSSLETIKCNDTWSADQSLAMFLGCENLHGGIAYDSYKLTVDYATPKDGYFYYYQEYPLYINGTQIDNTNSYDLTKIKGVTLMNQTTGKAVYNVDKQILKLRDVRIDADEYYALRNEGVEELTIEIGGNVNINGMEVGIMMETSTTLTTENQKESTLNVNAKGIALQAWKGTTTIEGGMKASFNAGAFGIMGGFAEDNQSLLGRLVLKNGNTVVYARGKLMASIGLVDDLVMEDGLEVVSPAGAQYLRNGATCGVLNSSGDDFIKDQTVIIKNPDAPLYGINILGVQVNHKNYTDLAVIEGVDVLNGGYANYNPVTNTLNLKNTTIHGTTDCLVECFNHGLKINLEGNNLIYSSSNEKESDGLCIYDLTTITGDGSLSCRGGNLHAAIYLTDTLIIDNGDVTGWGTYGIFGKHTGTAYDTRAGTLVMREGDGRVTAFGSEGCIHHLTSILYGGDTDIVTPEGAFYNFYDVVGSDGSVVKNQEVVIETPLIVYDLMIADIELTNRNLNDITRMVASLDPEAQQRYESGKMVIKYYPQAKLLTLRNAIIRIDENSGFGIHNQIEGLIIELYGDNVVESKQWMGIASSGSLTLTGEGSLSVKGYYALDFMGKSDKTLVVRDGAHAVFDGEAYGIIGDTRRNTTTGRILQYYTQMNVSGKSTVVRARGASGSLNHLKSLTLFEGLGITQPSGAVFENHSVCVGGYAVCNEFVEISAVGSGLKGDVNMDGKVDISDIVAVINTMAGDVTFKATSDVNGDGQTDISDVVAIINIIAGGL